MTVLTINGLYPDEQGNVILPHGPEGPRGDQGIQGPQGIQGVRGAKGEKGEKGDPGAIVFTPSGLVNNSVKIYASVTETLTDNGEFQLDISNAKLSKILNVQLTVNKGEFSQANVPLSAVYDDINSTNTLIKGKAFKVTSAGLLAAMQQTTVDIGTKVNVLVIGY